MPCINLLPWRQQEKIAKRRQHIKIALLCICSLLLLTLVGHHFLNKPMNQHPRIKAYRQSLEHIGRVHKDHNPLTRYALHDLKLVGIIGVDHHYNAWIKIPNGLLLRVNVGDAIGRNSAEIIAINEDHLNIRAAKRIGGQIETSMTTLSIGDSRKNEALSR